MNEKPEHFRLVGPRKSCWTCRYNDCAALIECKLHDFKMLLEVKNNEWSEKYVCDDWHEKDRKNGR